MVLSRNGGSNADGSFDWKDTVVDASIVGAMAFFSTYAATAAVGLTELQIAKTCAVAAAIQFFGFLVVKRGLKKKEAEQ